MAELQVELHEGRLALHRLAAGVLIIRLPDHKLLRELFHQMVRRVRDLLVPETEAPRPWVLGVHVGKALLKAGDGNLHGICLRLQLRHLLALLVLLTCLARVLDRVARWGVWLLTLDLLLS